MESIYNNSIVEEQVFILSFSKKSFIKKSVEQSKSKRV